MFTLEVRPNKPEANEPPSNAPNKTPTKISVFAIPNHELFQWLKDGLTLVLLEMEGLRAWAYMSAEAGLHMFLPADAVHKKQAIPALCETFPMTANKVPLGESGSHRAANTAPAIRRYHDAKNQTIRDHELDTTVHCSVDPTVRIEQAIDDSFHKRIMGLLIDEPATSEEGS
jgi:Co/Zn/Cd efflux system component